ncbi:signal transducer and activator of transcription 5A-like isoform X1 [Dermatophagoides pteronyssinus]|uniref:signal transducer and activator of transcription 5A-like isoform X1 n=1 Tax=Dermatophagoides pteronyssinus TaxID=6956 RepID=UPI003F662956
MWTVQNNLPEELQHQISLVYGTDVFPMEVRTILGEWIEKQPWSKIVTELCPETEALATALQQEFILKINSLAHTLDNNQLKYRLTQVAFSAQHRNPVDLASIIYYSLQKESRIISYAQSCLLDTKPPRPIQDSFQEINRDIQRIRKDLTETDEIIRQTFQDQEQLIVNYQDRQKTQTLLQNAQSNERAKIMKQLEIQENNLQTSTETLMKQRSELLDRLRECSNAINILMTKVLDTELANWHRGQQLLGNGVIYTGYTLDDIQDWCEALADFIWQNRLQIKRMQITCTNYSPNQYLTDSLYNLMDANTAMLNRLVKNTFVIEKQPPQVMKTNTRFTATVRLLVGCKLNLHLAPPNVSVHIISEHQAALLSNVADNSLSFIQNESAAGEILNNVGIMEYHAATTHLSVHFRNMQLKKIKRTEKKGTESVMDEKFALLFNSRFTISQEFGDMPVRIPCCVQTFSLPVVVIVHGNQEPHAHATITWDNAFAEQRRTSFIVPDKVPFYRVGEVLSQKFIANVGKGLSQDNLRFLAAKALRTNNVPDLNVLITWSQFSKEPLPDRNFTFWEWFYSILKITKEHLRPLWNDNLIHGFISRTETANILSQSSMGTFLLRFSDSEQGGLTVAWKGKSPDDNQAGCFMLQPFTAKDLSIRSLADRLNDLKNLTHLYPDTPKDMVFSKYYTPIGETTKTTTGYVKPVLVTCVPGLSAMSLESFPNTPQSSLQPHSPSDSNSMPFDSNQTSMDCTTVKQNGIHKTPPPPPPTSSPSSTSSSLITNSNNIASSADGQHHHHHSHHSHHHLHHQQHQQHHLNHHHHHHQQQQQHHINNHNLNLNHHHHHHHHNNSSSSSSFEIMSFNNNNNNAIQDSNAASTTTSSLVPIDFSSDGFNF